MKNKSFLSKFEELKPKVPLQLDVERKLLPRLKFMGYVMYILSIATLTFAITAPKEPGIGPELEKEDFANLSTSGVALMNDEDQLELNPMEVLNFYVVAVVFAAVGASCFLIGWKKKKTLFQETELNGE
ncbi:MAG: hypothetical protein JSS60_01025 [Verrucomicrobia bacterium]|nr:hypothetical protein [Verrucomicrobiota bacterium]